MAKLDARFTGLDSSASHTFNDQFMFDRTSKSMNGGGLSTDQPQKNKSAMMQSAMGYDAENTKKLQVSFNMSAPGNKSLLEQYRNQRLSETPTDNNQQMKTSKTMPEMESSHNYPNSTTPLYAKNPNMTNNKIGEILEISQNENIVPSPSGVTRCYVKYDEPASNNLKLRDSNAKETIQVKYLKNQTAANRVDSGTSPFVVLNSNDVRQEVMRKDEFKKSVLIDGVISAETNTLKPVTSKNTDAHMSNLGSNYFSNVIKEPKKLEKSKTVFVNLTPRPTTLSLEETEGNNIKIQQPKITTSNDEAFLLDHYKSNQFLDSEFTTHLDRTSMHTTNNKTIETPVSAKVFYSKQTNRFYSKQQSDHLNPIVQDYSNQPSDRLNPIVEEQQQQQYTCERRNLEAVNQMLNKKSISYYDNINRNSKCDNVNDENEQTDDLESEASYSPQMETNELGSLQPVSQSCRYLAPQTVENIQHVSTSNFSNKPLAHHDQQMQFPSTNNLNGYGNYDNYRLKSDGGLKRYDANNDDTNNNECVEQQFADQMKSIKTYYDGKRCWTSLSNSRSTYDNQNCELNEGYEPSQDSLKKGQLYNFKDDTDSRVNKKGDLHVKIKLPDESLEKVVTKDKKSPRKCQAFCLIVFTFLIFAVVIAILVFFIGCDKFTRERLFNSEIWDKWTNYMKSE